MRPGIARASAYFGVGQSGTDNKDGDRPPDSRSDPQDVPREPSWGAPRIHGKLLKLDIDIGESSVSKYLVRGRKPPSQTWRTFLENHLSQIVSVDFFTVPTIRFRSCTCSWCWLMIAVA